MDWMMMVLVVAAICVPAAYKGGRAAMAAHLERIDPVPPPPPKPLPRCVGTWRSSFNNPRYPNTKLYLTMTALLHDDGTREVKSIRDPRLVEADAFKCETYQQLRLWVLGGELPPKRPFPQKAGTNGPEAAQAETAADVGATLQ